MRCKRGVDFRDQLALAVARAQLDRPLGFERGAVGQIRLQQAFFLQMAQRTGQIGKQLGAPAQQLLPEIFDLQRVHELFLIVRTIVWRQHRAHSSPQTPVQNGGGVYKSCSPNSTVNAAIHRVDSARIPPRGYQRAPRCGRGSARAAAPQEIADAAESRYSVPPPRDPRRSLGIIQSNRGGADLELFKQPG